MAFGEFWPELGFRRATDANWAALEKIGGTAVPALRRRIDEEQRLADEAKARGDQEAARRHDEEAEELFEQLEEVLASVGGAR